MTERELEPITKEELQRRGMDDGLMDLVCKLVQAGSANRRQGRYVLTRDELWVFGFGPECECGERGLGPDEDVCELCPNEDEEEEATA